MQFTNKKLIKNFKDILSASVNAKGIIESEMAKVDAKYAEMAKKEKAELTKQASILESQITMYNTLLSEPDTAEDESTEAESTGFTTADSTNTTDEKVVDTLFPENNVVGGSSEIDDAVQEPDPAEELEDEFDEVEEEAKSEHENSLDDWPEVPEEWN